MCLSSDSPRLHKDNDVPIVPKSTQIPAVASYFKVDSPIWPTLEFAQSFLSVFVIWKLHGDLINLNTLCPEQGEIWSLSALKSS